MRSTQQLSTTLLIEDWLRRRVLPAYDALKANPSRAVSAKKLRATLAAEHRKAVKKR